ncbi:MAG: DUF551 domain-containing protein [Geobacter sp.]
MTDKACCTENAEIANTVNQSHLIEPLGTWQPVIAGNLPESGKRVIFSWLNDCLKRRTSIGFYAAAKTIDASDYEEPSEYEYDEEKDQYTLQEGWYEEGAEAEYFYPVLGVTHWMPLPAPPEGT